MCWRRFWELKLFHLHPLFFVRHLVCNLSAVNTCQSLISHAHQRPALPIASHLHLHFSVELHAKYPFPEFSRGVSTWLFFLGFFFQGRHYQRDVCEGQGKTPLNSFLTRSPSVQVFWSTMIVYFSKFPSWKNKLVILLISLLHVCAIGVCPSQYPASTDFALPIAGSDFQDPLSPKSTTLHKTRGPTALFFKLVYVRPAFCHIQCCYLYNNYL